MRQQLGWPPLRSWQLRSSKPGVRSSKHVASTLACDRRTGSGYDFRFSLCASRRVEFLERITCGSSRGTPCGGRARCRRAAHGRDRCSRARWGPPNRVSVAAHRGARLRTIRRSSVRSVHGWSPAGNGRTRSDMRKSIHAAKSPGAAHATAGAPHEAEPPSWHAAAQVGL